MRSAYDLRPDTALDWMDRARCRHYTADWWSVPHPGNERAKQICHGCPVKRECAEWGKDLSSVIVAGKTHYIAKREPRHCVHCGAPFESDSAKQLACSRRCNNTAYARARREAASGR